LKLPLKNEYQLAFFVFMCFVSFSSPVWAKGISDIAWHHLPSDSQELLCWRFNWSFLALVTIPQHFTVCKIIRYLMYGQLLWIRVCIFYNPHTFLCLNFHICYVLTIIFSYGLFAYIFFLPCCLFVNRRLMPHARRFLVK
jgi:hypothetical protein